MAYWTMIYFLGAFTKLRKATVSFIMSVCLPACPFIHLSSWNNTVPTGQILMKFDILMFSKICGENVNFIEMRQE
jgi:hypothetical protein